MATLSILTGMAGNDRDFGRYLKLMQQGSSCQATVVETDSEGVTHYSFSIGGRTYSGSAPNCSIPAGQRVTITYLANDPSNSCLGSPGARLADEVVSWLLGGLSFPSLS